MELVSEIYRTTALFPKDELYGLTSQIRRAAVSIPANIAEGQGRLTEREFCQFLGYARGSLLELETLIRVARDLNYLRTEDAIRLLHRTAETGRLLNGLQTRPRASLLSATIYFRAASNILDSNRLTEN